VIEDCQLPVADRGRAAKSEGRRPKWVSLTFEKMRAKAAASLRMLIRVSGFGFISDFGIRASDFKP